MISGIVESCGVGRQTERSEGQTQSTLAEVNFVAVFRRKSQSDTSIVKINREPQAWLIRRWCVNWVFRKQEGIRICCGRQIIRLILRFLGVRERQFGQSEQPVA